MWSGTWLAAATSSTMRAPSAARRMGSVPMNVTVDAPSLRAVWI
jgi:hypothetical protein